MTLIQNLTVTRGDTASWSATINNPPVAGLSTCRFWFTVKFAFDDGPNNTDSLAVIQKVTANFTIVTSGGGNPLLPGVITWQINPTDTFPLPGSVTNLVYDLQMEDASNNVTTLASGLFIISPDVTRST